MNEIEAPSGSEEPRVKKAATGGKKPEAHLQAGNAARARWHIRAFKFVVRGIFRLFFRVRVVGLRNVPPTPAIICANHLGWADAFLVLLFFPLEPRVYVLGEQDVGDGVINRILRLGDVEREMGVRGAQQQPQAQETVLELLELLDRQEALIFRLKRR